MKLKKVFKIPGITILTFILLIGIYLLSAIILSVIEVKRQPETTRDVAIFIITNGVHTDVVVPVKNAQMDWSKEIKYENTLKDDTSNKYLALGWGNKGFYLETPTWADLKFSTAFKAAFGLGSSAMHATFYNDMQEGNSCKKNYLSKGQYSRLIKFIRNSFKKDVKGHFQHIVTHANYGDNDAFYEATGSYNLFYTCNTWTNSALKSCGQKACLWTPFDKGIFYQYRKQK